MDLRTRTQPSWSSECMDSTRLKHWQGGQPLPPPPKGKPQTCATSQLHQNTSWTFAATSCSSRACTLAGEWWADVDSVDEVRATCTNFRASTACSQQQRLRCARPNCRLLVHSTNEFGKFCCGSCWCRHIGIGHWHSAHSEFCERHDAGFDTPAATHELSPTELELIHRNRSQQHRSMAKSWMQFRNGHNAISNEWRHGAAWTSAETNFPGTEQVSQTLTSSEQPQLLKLPEIASTAQLQAQVAPWPPPPPPTSPSVPTNTSLAYFCTNMNQHNGLRLHVTASEKTDTDEHELTMSDSLLDYSERECNTMEDVANGNCEGKDVKHHLACASALWLDNGLEDPRQRQALTSTEDLSPDDQSESTSLSCGTTSASTLSIWASLNS